MFKTLLHLLALLAMLCALMSSIASAQEKSVWQIGKLDGKSSEFAISGDFFAFPKAFPNGVAFQVGKDDPAKSWPFAHPGLRDDWAGGVNHSFTISFDLSEKPRGMFRLLIGIGAIQEMFSPIFEINLNGRKAEILLQPAKPRLIDLPLSPTFLRQGRNELVLSTREASWVQYDALQLLNDAEMNVSVSSVKSIILKPTVRFVKRPDGLERIVDLTAEIDHSSSSVAASVTANGKAQQVELHPNLQGLALVEVEVDDSPKAFSVQASAGEGENRKSAACDVPPARHWKLYLEASSHVDMGYSALLPRVIEVHNMNTSRAIDLCAKYPDFKWNSEAAWIVDNYLSMMPEDKKSEYLKLAREGRLGLDAIYGNMLTGICSHEELIRNLYYARGLSLRYGIPYDIAVSSDVPTQVWSLPMILAGSGIKYFVAGMNPDRSVTFNRLFPKSPFYWQGPDGSRVLTWLAGHYATASMLLGLASTVGTAQPMVDEYLGKFNRSDYPYDAVLGYGAFADNCALDLSLASVIDEWNLKYEYPKIIMCRGTEFFEYVQSKYADKIPTFSGDAGTYWEDGAASSAHETAMVRLAKEKLVASEKLYSLISTLSGSEYPKAEFDFAWKNAALYDEHTWGAWSSISDPDCDFTKQSWEYKAGLANKASAKSDELFQQGIQKLAGLVGVDKSSVLVFNPSSWPRSGVVSAPSSDGKTADTWVDDIPAGGYKVCPLNDAIQKIISEKETSKLENTFYRLELDPVTGAVKSLYDKELARELVDSKSVYGVNQYIYTIRRKLANGHGDPKDVTRTRATPRVKIHSASVSYGQELVISGTAYRTPAWETRIVLYNKEKRIDFINNIHKDVTYAKEAGYFAFPFNLNKPQFYVGIPNGVIRPDRDMLDGACMQWYSTQDFVAVADNAGAVVWTSVDSPLITISDINRETFKSPIPITNSHFFAYVFNNYWFCNYKASQGGDLTFRFAMTSMKHYDQVAASRFGQSVRNPLVASQPQTDDSSSKMSGLPDTLEFLKVSPSNIVVQTMKSAEYEKGLVIRLREVAGRQTEVSISLGSGKFTSAWLCSLVEDAQTSVDISNGTVKLVIPAYGLATILVK